MQLDREQIAQCDEDAREIVARLEETPSRDDVRQQVEHVVEDLKRQG